MKKIVVLIFITLLSGIAVNADDVKIIDHLTNESIESTLNINKDYDFIVNKKQLGKYLELDENDTVQLNNVYHTYKSFCDGMLMAGNADNEETRLNLIFNSIDYALRDMNCYLDEYQYRKFVGGLNVAFYNRGFLEETYLYSQKK